MTSVTPTAPAAQGSPSSADLAIEIVNVTKRYGSVLALDDVSLDIQSGEFLVLLGPSGCGKSTLLKLIAGLEDLTDGEIYIGGRLANYVKPGDRDVAMVFQNYALYPHMTVRDNLSFPLRMRHRDKTDVQTRVGFAASLLQLDTQLDKYPDQLSGGQRQRVALGRAIVREPLAFLMDEPLSNLDALLRVRMRTELLRLHRRVERTIVYVTHDQIEAMTMADRVVVMRAGVIQQVGKPGDVYRTPVNRYVATFVGSPPMNIFDGTLVGDSSGRHFQGAFSLPIQDARWAAVPEGPVAIGIRPEEVGVAAAGADGIPGVVELVEGVGADNYLSVNVGTDATVMVRVDASSPATEGDRVSLQFKASVLRLFDADGTTLTPAGAAA